MATENDLTADQIKDQIVSIQEQFGFRSKKMAEFIGIKYQTYRNNCNPNALKNQFRFIHLIRLKSGIAKLIKNHNKNENNNKTTTDSRRPFANHAISN